MEETQLFFMPLMILWMVIPFWRGTESFSTSDCSGSPTVSWKLGGAVTYTGAASSSICSAENFDVNFSVIEINGKTYSGSAFETVISQLPTLPRSRSSLACIYRDNYLEGLRLSSGRSNEKINPAFVFYPD